jgi:tetratricopeptide (TPR) repeat protein
MSKRIVSLIIAVIYSLPFFAQDVKNLQETFLEAEYFLLYEDYSDALPYYLQLYEKMPNNANLAYKIGICYLNIYGKKNLSISYLETASKKMSAKHKEGTINQMAAPYDALYELGNAYRINFQFDKAKEAYTKYRETLLIDDTENINFVEHEIKVCDNAKVLIAKPVEFTMENMGPLFNDAKSNFNPVISADGKSFAYMVSLKFYDAVMFSRLVNGKWTIPINITPDLQSDGDLYISCLSADGKTLFLSKNDNSNSDIFRSTFDGIKWSSAVKLNKNINTKYWESHAFISEDGNSLVFASDRPGGYGGLDIYISKFQNGDWGPAVNIGTQINTPFNEDRPFLINNGKTLFFSSQNHDNMGGYDIFRTDIQSNGLWKIPQNLGYPLNTPDDNIFFMPVGDGRSGYISLYKETDGYGKEDIYKITFKQK